MKPFCINIENMCEEEVQTIFDLAVESGANRYDNLDGYVGWRYLGVDYENDIVFSNIAGSFDGDDDAKRVSSIRELHEYLEIPEVRTLPSQTGDKSEFRNIKLRVTSEEQRVAFEEAVVASGGGWTSCGSPKIDIHCLYVDVAGALSWSDNNKQGFENAQEKEILFTPTTWGLQELEPPKPTTIELDGGTYTKELLLELIEAGFDDE